MQDESTSLSPSQRTGLAVFIGAIVATAALVVMGVTGIPWPKWLLALTAIF